MSGWQVRWLSSIYISIRSELNRRRRLEGRMIGFQVWLFGCKSEAKSRQSKQKDAPSRSKQARKVNEYHRSIDVVDVFEGGALDVCSQMVQHAALG